MSTSPEAMSDDDNDALRGLVDEAALTFDDHDSLELVLVQGKRVVLGQWSLEDVVFRMLDDMALDAEADNMLAISRHLAYLSRVIKSAVADRERGGE